MRFHRFIKFVSTSGVVAAVSSSMVATALPAAAWAQDAKTKPDAPGPAAKGPDEKTRRAARADYEAAQKAYEAGEYLEAYEGFKKAHERIPSPQAQYWIALSLLKAERKEEAEAALRAFLENPEAATAGDDKVTEAKQELSKLEAAKLGRVRIVTHPEGASVTVDGEPQSGQTPMELELSPGKHTITVTSAAYEPEELEVNIQPGELIEQSFDLKVRDAEVEVAAVTPEPTVAPPVEPEPEVRSAVPAYITLGLAGVSGIVGTIFGIRALSAKSDFDANPTESAADDVDRNALIADAAFGLTLTLGITGVVLLINSGPQAAPPPPPEAGRLRLTPFVGLKSAGASAELTF